MNNGHNDGWFWNLFMIMAGAGVIACVAAIVFGIIWIVNHVSIS